jgi:N-acetylneuraminic acid mutarotase
MPLLALCLNAVEQRWQELPALPEPNGGFVCGVLPGTIIVAGGTNWTDGKKQWLTAVRKLDLESLRWSDLGPLDQPLSYALVGVARAELLLLGGTSGVAAFHGKVSIGNGGVGYALAGGFAIPAVLAAGGQIVDELLCVGGTDDLVNAAGFRRDAFAWNLKTGEQRALSPYPGPAFGLAASAVTSTELFLFGGATWDATNQTVMNFGEAFAFSPLRNSWRKLKPFPFSVRGASAVALDDRHLYVAGGYRNREGKEEFTDQAFIYDVENDQYRPAAALPYRAMVGLVRSTEYVYCLGGEDKQKHRSAAAYRIKVADLLGP